MGNNLVGIKHIWFRKYNLLVWFHLKLFEFESNVHRVNFVFYVLRCSQQFYCFGAELGTESKLKTAIRFLYSLHVSIFILYFIVLFVSMILKSRL